jgi:hypothetical protein
MGTQRFTVIQQFGSSRRHSEVPEARSNRRGLPQASLVRRNEMFAAIRRASSRLSIFAATLALSLFQVIVVIRTLGTLAIVSVFRNCTQD